MNRLITRSLTWAAVLVTALLAVDGGSVLLTRLATPDQVEEAGHRAAAVVADRDEDSPTPQTAATALEAARDEARRHGITVPGDDFLVFADDSVELTGVATAPTLLLQRFAFLESLAEVTTTMTVEARTMDSQASSGRNR